jgi:hypothetical protein
VRYPPKWKAKYGELDVSELARVKEFESENGRLKRMYVDLALENEAIKAVQKRTVAPPERRAGHCALPAYYSPEENCEYSSK